MDINRVNNLLGQVRVKLESLDPANLEMLGEEDLEPTAGYEMNGSALSAARKKLQDLMDKLSANRSDSNRVRATGTGR
jgi:hypothetical protein